MTDAATPSLWARVKGAWTAFFAKAPKKQATPEKAEEKAPTPKPETPADPDAFSKDKERLRTLTTWLIGVFGAIATVMIAGSSLGDLGSLDTTTEVTLFCFDATRFEFAVIGLGVTLGAAATVVALCIWVQLTSGVSITDIERFPLKEKWGRIWGWRIRARVRTEVERELEIRGYAPSEPATGGTANRFATIVKAWQDAFSREQDARTAALQAEEELTHVRTPHAGTPPSWTDSTELLTTITAIATATPPALSEAASKGLDQFQKQLEQNYRDTTRETTYRFKIVSSILYSASFLRMRRSFGMVLKYIIGAAILAGVGIALFAWSTHPPKATERSVAVKVVPATEITKATTYLGTHCDPSTVKVEALGDTKLVAISAASTDADHDCELAK